MSSLWAGARNRNPEPTLLDGLFVHRPFVYLHHPALRHNPCPRRSCFRSYHRASILSDHAG
jgi:hypothetical protein